MKRLLIIYTILSFGSAVNAQQTIDPDWPCIQVLIPKISAAAIWDGPVVDEIEANQELSIASAKIIDNVMNKDQNLTEQEIESYLAQANEFATNDALTYLFKQFLDRLNNKRAKQIKKIKRYTKTQRGSAATIETLLDKITDLQGLSNQVDELQELESELHWQKRMFKEREKSFKYFCELPQAIFQQAGEIARAISARLEY